jgi:hypothetical protein
MSITNGHHESSTDSQSPFICVSIFLYGTAEKPSGRQDAVHPLTNKHSLTDKCMQSMHSKIVGGAESRKITFGIAETRFHRGLFVLMNDRLRVLRRVGGRAIISLCSSGLLAACCKADHLNSAM